MEVSVSAQAYVFFVMVAAGLGSGLVFDMFRAWRRLLRPGSVSTGIGDLLFWLLVSVGIFFVIFTVNNGEIRWFELVGLILGGLIYFLAFSHSCLGALTAVIKFFAKIILFLLKIILTPLVFLYKMIKSPLLWMGGLFRRFFRRTGRGLKKTAAHMGRGVKKLILVSKKS